MRLLVKVKACLLKNSLAHTLEAWHSSRVNESLRSDDIYIDLPRRNTPAASRECPCSLQIIKY